MYPEWHCFRSIMWYSDIAFLAAVAIIKWKLWTNKQKHCVLWMDRDERLTRLPSLAGVIFCLSLSPECRRNRGVHCCPKQGLLWERHCVHENTGHSRGTYQDLLHRQLWQPCTDYTQLITLSLYQSSYVPVSLFLSKIYKWNISIKIHWLNPLWISVYFVCLASEPVHCYRSRVRVWALESRLLHCGLLLQSGSDHPLGPQDNCTY